MIQRKLIAAMLIAISTNVVMSKSSDLKIMIYPSLIYESGKCSIFKSHLSKIMFLCFTKKDKIKDLGNSSKLQVDLPENLQLKYAAIMDGWKKGGPSFTNFATERTTHDGKPYIRYTVPLPNAVYGKTIKKPLIGGLYGTPGNGICENFTNIFVKPKGTIPARFKIYWSTTGKYNTKGSFPAYVVTFPQKIKYPEHIVFQAGAPLAKMANPLETVKDLCKVYKKAGIKEVNAQFKSGPNKGFKEQWNKEGFSFYGGDGFLYALSQYKPLQRCASSNMKDYLIGLDGKNRAYSTDSRAYYGRLWCPQAVITPGRYPYKHVMEIARKEAASGAASLDPDFEVMGWSHCFCPDCLKAFAKFSGLKYSDLQQMTPVQITNRYPMKWYKFRCHQTAQLFDAIRMYLKKDYPKCKIGCNALLVKIEKNLGNLKYGICNAAEDPRLVNDSVDFFKLDTLTGSLHGVWVVNAIKATTSKPVFTAPGNSYCVGYGPFYNAARRMTAEMTGDKFGGEGWERRGDLFKLAILHHAASGASGFKFRVDEPQDAVKTAEAADLLAKVEKWYLNGKRRDKDVKIIDLTSSPSPWLKDNSRIGRVWLHFYKHYNGKVQYRVHQGKEGILVSLFNWDYHQPKNWLLQLPADMTENCYITDISSNKSILQNGKSKWTKENLLKGVPVSIPPAGVKILAFTTKPLPKKSKLNISSAELLASYKAAIGKKTHDQYAWYTGKQIDLKKHVKQVQKRHLAQLKKYGGRKNLPKNYGIADVPFVSDFQKTQSGMHIWSSRQVIDNIAVMSSDKKYTFAGLYFRSSANKLKLTVSFKCVDNAGLGIILYEKASKLKMLSRLCWNKRGKEVQTVEFDLPADKCKNKICTIFLCNSMHKGKVLITQIKLTDK
jgi:hypothetical protein